ncbi:MAG TPA: hypothetical protein VIH27_03500 [Nitrososphaerales archaeon]
MGLQKFYIYVEGNDDMRFFNNIVRNELVKRRYNVEVRAFIPYKKETFRKYISAHNLSKSKYLCIVDYDCSICITDKKNKIRASYNFIDPNRLIVVVREIESWFIAGVDNSNCAKMGIPIGICTESVTKGKFKKFMLKRYDDKVDFMMEILKCFSIQTARKQNRSFNYFYKKHLC